MGFKKSDNDAEIAIAVTHAWHPGDVFTFYFPKTLPQAVIDDESTFYNLTAEERRGKYTEQTVNMVAKASTRAPEGFDDFPAEREPQPVNHVEARIRDYFNDVNHPELEEIIGRAWAAYKESAVSTAYLKSVPRVDAKRGGVSPATAKVEPVV